jgi:Domain of unknown function (DUF4398)
MSNNAFTMMEGSLLYKNSSPLRERRYQMIGKKNIAWPLTILVAVVILFMVGCASKVAPVENITSAEMAIMAAQESNASVHAPLELKVAADKLNQAKAAMEQEEFDKAQLLADEATVDAQLAEARSRSEKAKKVAQEMRDNIETLRHEIERSHNRNR